MRDDLYTLTAAERRRARAAWRAVPARQRLEAVRMAEQGLPAPGPHVSAAAREHGRYLLTQRLSNRLPRSLLPACGALFVVAGALLWSGALLVAGERATGLGVFVATGGGVTTSLGLLSWSQRRGAHLLVAANPVADDPPVDPRPSTS